MLDRLWNRRQAATGLENGGWGFEARRPKNQSGGIEIFIYDIIGPAWLGFVGADTVREALEGVSDSETVHLRINSPGGDISEATTIYNLLNRREGRVETDIDGLAGSSAGWLAMVGDVIRIAENGMMMLHKPDAITAGDADEHRKTAEVLDKAQENIVATFAARTGIDEATINGWINEETWFTGREAEQQGLVDSVTPAKSIPANGTQNLVNSAPDWAKARLQNSQPRGRTVRSAHDSKEQPTMITREQFQQYANANPADLQPYIDQAVKNEQAKHQQALEAAKNEAAENAKKEATEAERKRISDLTDLFGDEPDKLKKFIDEGTSVADASAEAFREMKKSGKDATNANVNNLADAGKEEGVPAQNSDTDTDSGDGPVSEDRKRELLNASPGGQAVLEARNRN